MLSKRLQYIVNHIPNCRVIADIGTDHGYLPIALIENKKASLVYAADINAQPLKSAQQNIDKVGFGKQIKTVLSDGIEFISSNPKIKKIDFVTISGLGTNTILDIITKNDNNKIDKYFIISNTEVAIIRHWAKKQKYRIIIDDFIEENKKQYWCILIDKKNSWQKLTKLELKYGDYKMLGNNLLYQTYLDLQTKKNEDILLKITNDKKRQKLFKKNIRQTRRYLSGFNKNN